AKLSGDPGRIRPFADGEMDHVPPIEPKDEEDVKVAKGDGRDREEVDGGDRLGVIAKEGPPFLRTRATPSRHVFGDGRLGKFMTEPSQLCPDARHAPSGFSVAMRRMRACTLRGIVGRPGLPRDFQRQKSRYPCRRQETTVAGFTKCSQDRQPTK